MCDVGEKGTKAFITEEGIANLLEKIDRLNNDIKTLLKENEAKEKVIKKQDYVINELEKWLILEHDNGYEVYYLMSIQNTLDKLKELKENNNE